MYDYVIVGAGSAGCVLAARLTEDPDVSVLLLEAGGPDTKENIHVPLGYLQLQRTDVDWDYVSAPEPNCGGRRIALPRGKVLGGSSSINAMVYIRGNHRDYDEWGAEGWAWDDLFPYFLKAEDNERGASEWHAVGGPLPVSEGRSGMAAPPAFVEAGVEAGLARNDDFNGAEQDGVGLFQVTQRDGMRASAAVAYLHPAMAERPEPDRDALHARQQTALRGHPGGRRRGVAPRPAAGAAGRARGDPLRRLLQLAAAADALRGRPRRAPRDARSGAAARSARGRREPQRSRLQLRDLDGARSRTASCRRSSRRRWRSSKPPRPGRSPPTSPRRAGSRRSSRAPRLPTSSSTPCPFRSSTRG